ncbi:MAG: putative quinol monooxygenase [Paracoccaceae bacterium]
MFVVTVRFSIEARQVEAFMPLMLENARASLADEEGCLTFDVCQDPEAPTEVFLYEVYDDRTAFQTHMTTPHFLSFSEEIEGMVHDKSVQTYTLLR